MIGTALNSMDLCARRYECMPVQYEITKKERIPDIYENNLVRNIIHCKKMITPMKNCRKSFIITRAMHIKVKISTKAISETQYYICNQYLHLLGKIQITKIVQNIEIFGKRSVMVLSPKCCALYEMFFMHGWQ